MVGMLQAISCSVEFMLIGAAQVHTAIRENPIREKKQRSKPADVKRWKTPKSSYETKKANLKAKLAALMDDE
jgi:large subunit ribosomal protein L5e